MVKLIRKYDRVGAKQMRIINKERKEQSLPPLKRKRKKTMRTYKYSGKYVGINGGELRTFTDPTTQKLMETTASDYVDSKGNATGLKRKEYQGKYPEWFKQTQEDCLEGDKGESWELYQKNVVANKNSALV